jgi:hypothetical protein
MPPDEICNAALHKVEVTPKQGVILHENVHKEANTAGFWEVWKQWSKYSEQMSLPFDWYRKQIIWQDRMERAGKKLHTLQKFGFAFLLQTLSPPDFNVSCKRLARTNTRLILPAVH